MTRPRTLVARLILWQFLLVFGLLLALGFVLDRTLERRAVDSLADSLAAEARTLQTVLPADSPQLQDQVRHAGADSGTRITIILSDGTVIADSEADPAAMEDHSDRPEVASALEGDLGQDQRLSTTTGESFLYVAAPVEGDRVVRTAIPLTEVASRQREVRAALFVGFLVAAIIAAVGASLVARGMVRPLRSLEATLSRMSSGDLGARADQSGPEEVASLAAAFNQMADRIQQGTEALEEAGATRELILSSMTEGVALFAPDGRVAFTNPSMAAHLGDAPTSVGSLLPVALREAVGAAAEGRPQQVSLDLGSPARWIDAASAPVEGGGVLLVVRDVTQERRLDHVRRDFVTNASHELKTPAATIQATAETLLVAAQEDPEQVPRFAEQLEREALRLALTVADLLDLSRLESGPGLEEPVDLDGVVNEELERFRTESESAGISLSAQLENVVVDGSRDDLGLMVRNLVSNAVRYTREGGTIHVRLEPAAGTAVLTVADSGVGIPARDMGRIFERFYRVDRARSRETGGTGLGLSIVRHVAENHGGSVEVQSELGAGSTFTVRLPISSRP